MDDTNSISAAQLLLMNFTELVYSWPTEEYDGTGLS